MQAPPWIEIVTAQDVPAPTHKLWTKVCDFIRGPARIRIEAEGEWRYDLNVQTGPDGNPADGFSETNLAKSALRGCLLAKVGGSAGDTPGDEKTGKIQAVGSYCVFDLAAESIGALFLTMNDDPKGFHLHAGSLRVTVSTTSAN